MSKVFSQGEEGRGQASPPARQLHSSIGTRYRTSGFPGLRRRLRRCRRRKLKPRTKTRHILCAVCISHVNMQTLEVWMHEGEAAASPAKAGGRSRAVSGVRKKLKFLILAEKSNSTQKKLEEVGPEIVQKLKEEPLFSLFSGNMRTARCIHVHVISGTRTRSPL